MKYESGGAFRKALEKRLRDLSIQSGIALDKLRKMVAFDRFLARLIQGQPGQWVLKGGLALQLRLGDKARDQRSGCSGIYRASGDHQGFTRSWEAGFGGLILV